MTITQIEYVLAVAKHKHFGRAAESCFVTQPTLSMQIQKLEDELQATLFDRSQSPVALTPEGDIVVTQGKRVIAEYKKIAVMLEQMSGEVQGDFTLAVIPTLTPFIVPLFLNSFVSKFEKVNLKIIEKTTEEIIKMLKDGQIDGGILVTPLYEKLIEERNLYYEPFQLFVDKTHPLSKKKLIEQSELNIEEIWMLNKGNCFRDQVLNICDANVKDIRDSLNFESGNFETLKNMVLSSGGYTILPQMAVEQLSPALKKLTRPFKKPIPVREVSLVHMKSSLKAPIISAMEEEILSVVPDQIREFEASISEVIDI